MKGKVLLLLLCAAVVISAVSAQAQLQRQDAVWARVAPAGTITVDGQMNEAAWAAADSVIVEFGAYSGLPGGGWRWENGILEPTDPTYAVAKFLVSGDKLYVGILVKDKSVGGGLFNHFDGFLMNIRDKAGPRPAAALEYFYGWVAETWADTNTAKVGALPNYFGPRSYTNPERADYWNAVTTVQGISNSDTTEDEGYTTEFEFNVSKHGYDVTKAELVGFTFSVYDNDYEWPLDVARQAGNRAWWQCPWGNGTWFNTGRIMVDPAVTVTSGAAPAIDPDVEILSGANYADPTIDGSLNEDVWAAAPSFTIAWGDTLLRASYPGAGALRSGQFQPELGGVRAPVQDPGLAVVKYFYKGDMLYLGVDVSDQVVVSKELDFTDAFRLAINDRADQDTIEHWYRIRNLLVKFDSLGNTVLDGYLPTVVDTMSMGEVKVAMKPNTTVNDPSDFDEGWYVEMAIDLKAIGYPAGLGDKALFMGATLYDGDAFTNPADDYGTRTWFFREGADPWTSDAAAWCVLSPTVITSIDDPTASGIPERFELMGNFPNPFNPSTQIRYAVAKESKVTIQVFDLLGRAVATVPVGIKQAGVHESSFSATALPSGAYFYRVEFQSTATGQLLSTLIGKMMLLK
ncbi:MAG: T9SS type A sorting domain-containing protein [Candidatus Eisenbacteria bacterium]|jgi:hypothetical protein|nr:T9SS type A sorting domain-containing protein [Candidatus Eisenbacteria bacterium]